MTYSSDELRLVRQKYLTAKKKQVELVKELEKIKHTKEEYADKLYHSITLDHWDLFEEIYYQSYHQSTNLYENERWNKNIDNQYYLYPRHILRRIKRFCEFIGTKHKMNFYIYYIISNYYP